MKQPLTSHHKVALAVARFGSLAPALAVVQTRKRIYHTHGGPLHMAEPLCVMQKKNRPLTDKNNYEDRN